MLLLLKRRLMTRLEMTQASKKGLSWLTAWRTINLAVSGRSRQWYSTVVSLFCRCGLFSITSPGPSRAHRGKASKLELQAYSELL